MKEVCHWEQALTFQKSGAISQSTFRVLLTIQDVSA